MGIWIGYNQNIWRNKIMKHNYLHYVQMFKEGIFATQNIDYGNAEDGFVRAVSEFMSLLYDAFINSSSRIGEV